MIAKETYHDSKRDLLDQVLRAPLLWQPENTLVRGGVGTHVEVLRAPLLCQPENTLVRGGVGITLKC